MMLVAGMLMSLVHAAFEADALRAADVRDVKVQGEIGRRIDITIANNLMVVDLDHDFLDPFRKRSAKDGYIGLGKTIDAAVRLAAYSQDPRVIERKEYLVRETIATQEPDGYIGMLVPESRMWICWDVHEMSYLIYGLAMDHRFFKTQPSLDAARKLADYIIARWTAEPEKVPGGGELMDYMAFTGLESAMLALYTECGDSKYLDFAAHFRHLDTWDGPIVLGRWGNIQGHAYAYVGRALAQLHLCKLTANESLLRTTNRAMDFLLKQDGLVITGTAGQHECWHDTQEGATNLGETCATAYLIRWWDELLRMDADPLYGDLMERAIYNALFAAQSPDGRQLRYYSPFEGKREYFKGDTYCCPCNFRRIMGELPGMIYYASKDGIYVNLYTPSSAKVTLPEENVVELRQETDYPSAGHVLLEVKPSKPAKFAVQLRIPRWCEGATVTVNGVADKNKPEAGKTFTITREWSPGDRLELDMPMALRLVKGYKAQAGRVAVMYGPLVFCLNREKNPAMAKEDLRLITINPATLSGPFPDESIHPKGLACKVSAWRTTTWYPFSKPDWELTLTEFPDPAGEMSYFHVPNPNEPMLVEETLRAK